MPAAASRMHLSHLTGPDMPSASSNAIDPLLTKAIEDAPKTRLIWLLNKLVQCNEHAAALAQTLMLTNENAVVKKRCADEDVGPAAKKCKRYELCAKCDEEFDVLLNTDRSCYWHPGEREVDYDSSTWWDWDERCHGTISDQEDEYPEGFQWTCCEKSGVASHCKVGKHSVVRTTEDEDDVDHDSDDEDEDEDESEDEEEDEDEDESGDLE